MKEQRSLIVRVTDFFCGAGGLSEGFRLAGFDVIWAVDKWQPAALTHQKNHPTCQTLLDDVEKIAYLPDEEFHEIVPDSEIIVGSPPCVDFSSSNRSGKADKSKGLRLIKAFLRIVARKKFKTDSVLKYWILENVPNARFHVNSDYSAQELGLDGDFKLQVIYHSSHIYNAQDFGVPSKRIRFICGDFPEPQKTNSKENLIPLSYVLNDLGAPKDAKENLIEVINDPNYCFHMLRRDVTDHHYIHELAEFEWQKAKRLKQDKGYMGKMSFPENINKPGRTVMATMSFSAREAMIFEYGDGTYRAPTIREIASLMSFPLDYRFYGKSIGLKYQLVGNAVPPKMAYAFAKAIAQEQESTIPQKYTPLIFENSSESFINLNWQEISVRKEKPKLSKARFKYHIPYFIIRRYRVELTNYYSDFENNIFKWNVEIHYSQGPTANKFTPQIIESTFGANELTAIEQFKKSIEKQLSSFDDFQKIYCMIENDRIAANLIGPYELLNRVKSFIELFRASYPLTNDYSFNQEPYTLPRDIALSYFVLQSIINQMEGM
jgi:DNA (cytosine-5)-methyltransferase 1